MQEDIKRDFLVSVLFRVTLIFFFFFFYTFLEEMEEKTFKNVKKKN